MKISLFKIQLLLLGMALALQFSPVNAAQKKEGPGDAPIVVQVDAQKKEDPNYRPITVAVDAQKKEDPNARPISLLDRIHAWFFR